MSLCTSLFQKSLYELTIGDLESFFSSEQEETSVLEFKAGKATLEDIHKEVSAFLNTEGGLLIIGAPVEAKHPDRKHIKICKGALTPSTISDQDTLMRSIASNISPSPTTIKAKTLSIEGGSVYVLEIGQSINPPHQVSATCIYYIRLERDAKPAPHGLVEALFFRRQKSDLRVKSYVTVKPDPRYAKLTIEFTNESLVHIDRLGWLVTLHGVRTCKSPSQTKMSWICDDITSGNEEIQQILVQGMQIKIEFDLALRYPIFFCRYSYYSKDQRLEHFTVLFDTFQNKSLFAKSSHREEDNIGECDNVFDEYEKLLQKYMFKLLRHNYTTQVVEPASLQLISDIEYALDITFPRSLIAFWLLTDGFSGPIGGHSVYFWPVSEVKDQPINKNQHGKNSTLQIGFIESKPILLKYKDGIGYFEWTSFDGIVKSSDLTSFLDLIDDLYRSISLKQWL